MAKASVWLTLEPTFGRRYDPDAGYYRPTVNGMKVVKMTQKKPEYGAHVVQVEIDVPDAVFQPLLAKVAIEVPEDAILVDPDVTIDVVSPAKVED